jgi:23S rRNA pseudouridine2605 synthase
LQPLPEFDPEGLLIILNLRLQKFLAEAGVSSRRGGEELIQQGHVQVNGKVVRELGTKVDPDKDLVFVDGRQAKHRRKLYIAINKPAGYLCTRHDPQQRRCVGDLLPAEWSVLYPVGRLDNDSDGLLFLTNDGDFCLRLTHPRYGIHKKYITAVVGKVEDTILKKLTHGIELEGELLKATRVRCLSRNNSHTVVEVELAEGKNREVRRLFSAFGFEVERLQRVQIGPVKLGELPLGKWRTLTPPEIKSLMPQI